MTGTFETIHAEDTNEARLIRFMPGLFRGVQLSDGRWAAIRQTNLMSSAKDEAMYRTDFTITIDGTTVGYVDPEKKIGWHTGTRPAWEWLNIPVHPMTQWERGQFGSRTTNKLQSFTEQPFGSFFVAARRDWEVVLVVPFLTVIQHGTRREQATRYSDIPLPVISVPMQHVTHIEASQDDELSAYIIRHLEEQTRAAH